MNTNDENELRELSVLIVDDDQGYRHLMADMLHSINVRNTPMAGRAEEARQLLHESQMDFVFIDRTLEGAGGLTLMKYLRNPEKTPTPHIPIVMTSDTGGIKIITAAIKAGADHVLVKPISAAEIESTLRNLGAKPPKKIDIPTYVGPCRRRLPQKLYGPYTGEDRRDGSAG